jgi:hypothetical protein
MKPGQPLPPWLKSLSLDPAVQARLAEANHPRNVACNHRERRAIGDAQSL